MDAEKKPPTPPYVSYKTLKNFLEKFKQGTPSRIDKDLMGTMSGAAQSQVTTALKYLGFISDNNLSQDVMKRYVVAEDLDRKKMLRDVLIKAYPFILGDGFDLGTATASLLREAFEANTAAKGETVDRCMAFFKDAAQDAGITVSRFITQKKARTRDPKKRVTTGRSAQETNTGNSGSAPNPHTPPIPPAPPSAEAQSSLLLWGLFQRLPKPGTVWPKEQRDQWTQTLNNVLGLEYKDS